MACAKCGYYMPKPSSRFLPIEAKSYPLRMRQEIPLAEAEAAAVDEGIGAMEKLCAGLKGREFRDRRLRPNFRITDPCTGCVKRR